MPHISLRLFGLGARASGSRSETRFVPDGTTVGAVWNSFRSSSEDHDFMGGIDEKQVSMVLNGKLVRQPEALATVLMEGDKVTFMILATGG